MWLYLLRESHTRCTLHEMATDSEGIGMDFADQVAHLNAIEEATDITAELVTDQLMASDPEYARHIIYGLARRELSMCVTDIQKAVTQGIPPSLMAEIREGE